jgi:Spy/CpxP family protein refolding chaperone
MKMKKGSVLVVFVLLLPVVAFAQTPAPTPAAVPSRQVVAPAPDSPGNALFAGDQQESYPRQPQSPQPPQPPRPDLGKWWKNSDVVRELEITETQITQIEQSFMEHRLKLIDLRAEVERQETRLQPLIEADRPDEAKVGAQIDLLLAARGKLEKENAMMMLAIRRVLSVEQWKKLESIQQGRGRMPGAYTPQHPSMRRQGPSPAPPASTPPPRPPDSEND